jgi:nicotinamidase-related amidase
MPLTKLDSTAAMVVIDLQKGIVGMATVHPIREIIARVAQLARSFRERGLPVVLVNVTGAAPGRPTPDLATCRRFPPIGRSSFPSCSSSPAITSLASNESARSSGHLWMNICVSGRNSNFPDGRCDQRRRRSNST